MMPHVPISQRPPEERKYWQLPSPYKLQGPVLDMDQPEPAIIAGAAHRVRYNADLQPGLVMMLDSSTYGRPRWIVMFREDASGKHRFVEAGTTDLVIADLWDCVEYLLNHCRLMPRRAPAPLPFHPVITPRAPFHE